MNGIFEVI